MKMVITQQASTKQDILQYLLKQGQANAHELATELDISPPSDSSPWRGLGWSFGQNGLQAGWIASAVV